MRFQYYGEPYEVGYYAEPPEMGYYAEPVESYYGEAPEYAGYGYGVAAPYYGQVEPGYGEAEPVGYYAEELPFGYYGEDPYAAMGEYEPVAGCGEMPEMVGYGYDGGGYDEYEPLGEEYPGVADFGAQEVAGYVRDVPPAFNAGCPMPTNVAGLGEAESFAGYIRPTDVNASCQQFTPQAGGAPSLPDTFRPLW